MQPPKYQHRPHWPIDDFYDEQPVRGSVLKEYGPYVLGGVMLVAAFAFAGQQIGQNASANTASTDIEQVQAPQSQPSEVAQKGSLLPEGENLDLVMLNSLRRQTVMSDGKGDMLVTDPGVAPASETVAMAAIVPTVKPVKRVAEAVKARMRIEPAAINLQQQDGTSSASKRMALAPKSDGIEKSLKLGKAEKQKVVMQRRVRLAEENCLARAVYFEARSESEIGQMAVAKVILNRVKAPNYAKSICGVVYEGSNRRNSCQFSFACDGQPDDVKQPGAWAQAKKIAQRAIAGDSKMAAAMNGVLHYHADYVKPKWSRAMRKAVKIGRHIFYAGG